jgi:hypothetical protein
VTVEKLNSNQNSIIIYHFNTQVIFNKNVRLEVLTAVKKSIVVFWVAMLSLGCCRRFGGMFRLHLRVAANLFLFNYIAILCLRFEYTTNGNTRRYKTVFNSG